MQEGIFALCCHHLLQQQNSNGELRFTMLETIREYALERLNEHQETAIVQKNHSLYYLQVVEAAESELQDASEAIGLHKLTLEYANIRVALEWALHQHWHDVLARFAGVLYRFWFFRDLQTGRYWLEMAIAHWQHLSSESLAKVLLGAGTLASRQRDYAQATVWLKESLALYEQLNSTAQLFKLHYELGIVSLCQEAYHQAQAHFECSLTLARQLGTVTAIGLALAFLPAPLLYQGHCAQAKLLLQQALQFNRDQNNAYLVGVCLVGLGHVLLAMGEYEQVQQHCAEVARFCQEFQYQEGWGWVLEMFAGLAAMQQQPEQAVRLYSAAEQVRQETGAPVPPHIQKFYAPFMATARQQLAEVEFIAAWAEGRSLSPENAITF
jgi:tetratricopeptide (TPR) repeat protein